MVRRHGGRSGCCTGRVDSCRPRGRRRRSPCPTDRTATGPCRESPQRVREWPRGGPLGVHLAEPQRDCASSPAPRGRPHGNSPPRPRRSGSRTRRDLRLRALRRHRRRAAARPRYPRLAPPTVGRVTYSTPTRGPTPRRAAWIESRVDLTPAGPPLGGRGDTGRLLTAVRQKTRPSSSRCRTPSSFPSRSLASVQGCPPLQPHRRLGQQPRRGLVSRGGVAPPVHGRLPNVRRDIGRPRREAAGPLGVPGPKYVPNAADESVFDAYKTYPRPVDYPRTFRRTSCTSGPCMVIGSVGITSGRPRSRTPPTGSS